jgi:SPASM domain peptide maturase of grasp-with-spasm system
MIVKKDSGDAYLKLFSSVKLTKGYKQTLLVDFDRNKIRVIPNDLYEFIEKCKLKPFVEVFKEYDSNNQQIINEYIVFLEEHEYIIFTNKPNRFPRIDLTWKSPNYISNVVVDVDGKSNHDYLYIIKLLDSLGCQALDVRVFKEVGFKSIVKLLEASKDCRLKTLRILLPYVMLRQDMNYNDLFMKYPRLEAVVFHGAPKNECKITNSSQSLLFITNKIDSPCCCGYVSEKLMICSLELFSEAQNYNTCLNKKLSIDVNGNIKNCNAMKESFGHYKKTDIKRLILEDKQYTKFWKINKNNIHTCKECEFKYVCVDCRANIKNGDMLSKPSKCSYNPYVAKWENS